MPGVIHNNMPGPQDASQFNPYDPTVWRWDVGRTEDPGDAAISTGDATVTKYGYLFDPSKLLAAQAYFLGYSQADPVALTLNRSVPAFCPESPWLLCTQFGYKGIKYTGDQDYPWDDSPGALPLPGFTYYRCSVTFSAVDYLAIPDEDMPGLTEADRFVSVVPDDQVELVNVDGGQYVYRSTQAADTFATDAGAATANPIYLVKGAHLRVHASRTGFLVTWYNVDRDYVCDKYTDPVALVKAKGTVNSTTFLNRPPYTMLLSNYKFVQRPAVIATLEADKQKFSLEIQMFYKFTNPEKGDPNETYGGWLLVPAPGTNSRKGWYYAWNYNALNPTTQEYDHNYQDQGLYDTYDHNKIFGHFSNA